MDEASQSDSGYMARLKQKVQEIGPRAVRINVTEAKLANLIQGQRESGNVQSDYKSTWIATNLLMKASKIIREISSEAESVLSDDEREDRWQQINCSTGEITLCREALAELVADFLGNEIKTELTANEVADKIFIAVIRKAAEKALNREGGRLH